TVLGKTLKKLCPHVKDILTPERAWDVGDLPRCREAFDRVMNWPNHNWEPPQEPSCVPADSNPRVGPGSATSQGGPIEERSWDQFGPSDDRKESEKFPLAPQERLKEG